MANGFGQGFVQGFIPGFQGAQQRQAQQATQRLQEARLQTQQKAQDIQVTGALFKIFSPNVPKSARKFLLRQLAPRLGVPTDSSQFKDFESMVTGLDTDALQQTQSQLEALLPSLQPGQVGALTQAVIKGDLSLTDALDAGRDLQQQGMRADVFGGGAGGLPQPAPGGVPSPQQPPTGPSQGPQAPTTLGDVFPGGQPPTGSAPAPGLGTGQPTRQPGQPKTAADWRRDAQQLFAAGDTAGGRAALEFADQLQNEPETDKALRDELGKRTGELWGEFLKTGTTAAGLAQDLEVMGQLIEIAPTGPLTGRLVQMFPGASDAASAMEALVNKLAPKLRVEGSGATSDLEFEAMRRGLPNILNKPGANRLIAETFRAKAQIDIARADVVRQFQNGQISREQATTQLGELDRQSILSPRLKGLIGATGPEGEAPPDLPPPPPGVSPEEWQAMDPEDRALWQN